jgi:predicted TIM-barrel fold metal-dependent hydrolase
MGSDFNLARSPLEGIAGLDDTRASGGGGRVSGAAGFAIVDAHQHFWDPGAHYYPWLNDEPPIAFRYGDYRAIRRRYLPPDYLRDATGYRVEKSVYVETEWDPADPVGEMRYVDALRRQYGLPAVAVAQVRLDRDDAAFVLEQQAAFSFVRSIRHKPSPGAMVEARWRAGFAQLARNKLRFDLQTPWLHLAEAARLAADFPGTQIILNHTGLPADRSSEGIGGWKRAMKTFAACPNAALKISGLGEPGKPWTVEANRGIVRTAIDLFGAARCMFASNFPVDSLCADFGTIFDGFREIVRDLSPPEQDGLFRRNAIRIYGME